MDRGTQLVEQFREVLNQASELDRAAIYGSDAGITQEFRAVTIDLTTARLETDPYVVGFPFKSFFVTDGTDSNVSISMRLASQDTGNDLMTLKKGSTLKLPYPVRKAFIHWAAQSGKTITIWFFLRGEFNTNVLNLVNSGSVTIGDGDAVTVQTTATVSTAASLFSQDTTRKKMMISNLSGVRIYLGGAATVTDDSGALVGIPIEPGESYAWENTAQCYAVSQGGVSTGQKISLVKFS